MISLRKRQEGFTIVELLIVIVIIGILATLVIVTFTGTQQKARNSQRQTDINAINSHLASYYAENGSYPDVDDLADATWRSNNMKGLDDEALVAPKGTIITATAGANNYGYAATPTGCGTDGDPEPCTGYTLTAHLEGGAPNFVKQSSN